MLWFCQWPSLFQLHLHGSGKYPLGDSEDPVDPLWTKGTILKLQLPGCQFSHRSCVQKSLTSLNIPFSPVNDYPGKWPYVPLRKSWRNDCHYIFAMAIEGPFFWRPDLSFSWWVPGLNTDSGLETRQEITFYWGQLPSASWAFIHNFFWLYRSRNTHISCPSFVPLGTMFY